MKTKGFTLIELMIVVAIIAIIAAIAIPNLLRSRMSANEASAIGSMRTISTSQASFQAAGLSTSSNGLGQYGTLAALAAAKPPFIDSTLGGGTKAGYTFKVTASANSTAPTFTCVGSPQTVGSSGQRSFFVDHSGVVTFVTTGTPTSTSSPLN